LPAQNIYFKKVKRRKKKTTL